MGGGAGEGKGEKGGVLTDLRSQRLAHSRVPRSAHPGCCWLQPAWRGRGLPLMPAPRRPGLRGERALPTQLSAGVPTETLGVTTSTDTLPPGETHADEHARGPLG